MGAKIRWRPSKAPDRTAFWQSPLRLREQNSLGWSFLRGYKSKRISLYFLQDTSSFPSLGSVALQNPVFTGFRRAIDWLMT